MINIFSSNNLNILSITGIRVAMLISKFILALFIAKFMGLEELGLYGLIFATTAITQACVGAGLSSYIVREATHQSIKEVLHNTKHYLTFILSIYFGIFILIWLLSMQFDKPWLMPIVIVVIATEHLSADIFRLANCLKHTLLANVLLFTQSALWIYVFICLAFLYPELRSIQTIIMFWTIGGILMILTSLFITRKWPWYETLYSKFEFSWYKKYLTKSYKLYLSELTCIPAIYIDRYFIALFTGLELTGVYVLFWQVSNAILNLVNAGTLEVARPYLILAYKEKRYDDFKQTAKKSLLSSYLSVIFISAVSIIVLPFLLQYTQKPLAIEYIPLFWAMLVVLLIKLCPTFLGYLLYTRKQDATIAKSNLLSLVLLVVISPVFLWLWGIWGVIPSSILAYILVMFYQLHKWR